MYVYRHDGLDWNLESKIQDPSPSWTSFGEAVALDDNAFCVGTMGTHSPPTPGQVFVFRYNGSGWAEEDVFSGSNATSSTSFGDRVDIFDDVIVSTDLWDDDTVAYVFRRQGSSWSEEARLVITDPSIGPVRFCTVAVGADVIVAGLRLNSSLCDPAITFSGAGIVFGYDGFQWRWEDTLCPADAASDDYFGEDVALDGLLALVGSFGNGFGDKGAVYSFQLDRDSDGDGLFDTWETQGIPIPGGPDLYVLPGADPQHKNLYVEVDAMDGAGIAPSPAVLSDVAGVFASAPVSNPDGVDGINLHVEYLDSSIPTASFPGAFTDFDAMKSMWFGSPAERADPDAINILQAKRLAFRYGVFGESYSGGSSSGLAEVGGNDFMVTLGLWSTVGGTSDEQKGTFLHEFGHTLGLRHGGKQRDPIVFERYNYKTNYYSVMNYNWQFPRAWHTSGSWPFDYSRSALPDLDESDLDENAGLGAQSPIPPAYFSVPYNGAPIGAPPSVVYALMGLGYKVDWDNDGVVGPSSVARDVNRIDPSFAATPGDVLKGHDDWSNISYNFRNSSDFADGVHLNTTLGDELDLPLSQKIDALPTPPLYYCTAGTSASGCQALLFLAGSPSSSASTGFTVTAFTVEGQKDGFFFYGTSGRQAQPWGNGTSYKCVAPPTIRTPTINSSGTLSGCDGSMSRDMSAYWTAFPGDNPGPGIPIDLQLWYRDPQNTSNQTTSLSNAVEFVLEP